MRTLLLALAAFLIPVSTLAASLNVFIHGNAAIFYDVDDNTWFAPFVKQAAETGVVNGYTDASGRLTGRFGPQDSVTIAQILKMATEAAGYFDNSRTIVECTDGVHSISIVPCPWTSRYVLLAINNGWEMRGSVGWEEHLIHVPAMRMEVAKLIVDAFDVTYAAALGTRFHDVSRSAQYAAQIEALAADGIISGDLDIFGNATGYFRPTSMVNRAEAVKMVIRARERYGRPGASQGPIAVPTQPDDDGESSSVPNDENDSASTAIRDLCARGNVHQWHYKATGEVLFELRAEDSAPAFGGTYEFYNKSGVYVGSAQWTDTPSYTLEDGTQAFCTFNGTACPEYVAEVC